MANLLAFSLVAAPARRWSDRDEDFTRAVRQLHILQRSDPDAYRELLSVIEALSGNAGSARP